MPDRENAERVEPDCLDTLGLHDQPFMATSTSYQDQDREARLDIALGILRDGGIAVLSGPIGIGKTTFLYRLKGQATDLAATIIQGDAQLRLPDIVEAMGAEGGEATPSAVWKMLRDADKQPVLAIDNGEDLAGSVFKRLVRLQGALAENGLALPLIIACDQAQADSLMALLEANRNSLVQIERIALSGFGMLDTSAYLRLRLAEAGGDYTLLDDKQLARIHRRSGGNPQRIHTEAARELERSAGRSRRSLPKITPPSWLRGVPGRAIAGGTGAVVIAAAGLVWWLAGDEVDATRIEANQRDVVSATAPENASTGEGASSPPTAPPANESSEPGELAGEPTMADGATPTEDATTARSSDSSSPSAPSVPPSEGQGTSDDATRPSSPDDNQGQAAAAGTPPEDDEPLPTKPTRDEATGASEDADEQLTDATDQSEPTQRDGATPSDNAASAAGVELDTDWYTQQPGDSYTVQLLGAREPSTVKRFLGQISSPDDTRILRTSHNGDPWYVVVTGAYAEREAASESIQSMPSGWREHAPFPRPFNSLAPPDDAGQ